MVTWGHLSYAQFPKSGRPRRSPQVGGDVPAWLYVKAYRILNRDSQPSRLCETPNPDQDWTRLVTLVANWPRLFGLASSCQKLTRHETTILHSSSRDSYTLTSCRRVCGATQTLLRNTFSSAPSSANHPSQLMAGYLFYTISFTFLIVATGKHVAYSL